MQCIYIYCPPFLLAKIKLPRRVTDNVNSAYDSPAKVHLWQYVFQYFEIPRWPVNSMPSPLSSPLLCSLQIMSGPLFPQVQMILQERSLLFWDRFGLNRICRIAILNGIFLFAVNRIKDQYKVSVRIPPDNEKSNLIRIEGDPQGVQEAKRELLELASRMVSSGNLNSVQEGLRVSANFSASCYQQGCLLLCLDDRSMGWDWWLVKQCNLTI